MSVDHERLYKLIEAFESSDWDEIHIKGEDFEIRLSTSADASSLEAAPAAATTTAPPTGNGAAAAETEAEAPPPPAEEDVVERPATQTGAEGEQVLSPSVGIFWRAPSPTSPPFVEIGDEVTPDDTLCIVEVMKLMTQVGPGMSGKVVDILVANGEPVQKGQPLFTIQT